jgi:hypothetical protein
VWTVKGLRPSTQLAAQVKGEKGVSE